MQRPPTPQELEDAIATTPAGQALGRQVDPQGNELPPVAGAFGETDSPFAKLKSSLSKPTASVAPTDGSSPFAKLKSSLEEAPAPEEKKKSKLPATMRIDDGKPGSVKAIDDALAGLSYGLGDAPHSAYYLATDAMDPDTARKGQLDRQLRNLEFDQKYRDNPFAQGGRVVGELPAVIGAMYLAGRGARALGAMVPKIAPGLEFLAGEGGKGLTTRTLSKMASGAVQGAGTTPLIYAGGNEDLGTQTGRNALFGAVLNPALHLAGKAVQKGRDIYDFMTATPEKYAENKFIQALIRDGVSLDEALARYEALGPEATLFDIGGENTRGLGRAVAGTPGPAKERLTQTLDARKENRPEAILSTVKKVMGTDADYNQTLENLVESRSKNAAPLYEEAFKSNQSISSPKIDRILETPAGKEALSGARTRMQNARTKMAVPDEELTDQALDAGLEVGKVASGLKMRTLDYIKQDLYDQAQALKRQGKEGLARDIDDLRTSLTSEMDRLDTTAKAGPNSMKPEGGAYARARAAYAGPSESKEALELGSKFMKGDVDLTVQQIKDMPDSQREFLRIGAVKAAKDIMRDAVDGADITKKLFGTKGKRERWQAILGSKEAYDEFSSFMKKQKIMSENERAILQGSRTTPMAAEMMDAPIDPGEVMNNVSNIMSVAQGNPVPAALNFFGDKLQRMRMLSPEKASALGNIGLPVDQQAGAATLKNLLMSGREGSILPEYLRMLGSAYGIPATTLGVNRLIPPGPASE